MAARTWHGLLNEPQGQLLGRCAHGSFLATLKGELVEERDYVTLEEARADVFQYIKGFYNRHRLHSSIGYCTPEQKAAE